MFSKLVFTWFLVVGTREVGIFYVTVKIDWGMAMKIWGRDLFVAAMHLRRDQPSSQDGARIRFGLTILSHHRKMAGTTPTTTDI